MACRHRSLWWGGTGAGGALLPSEGGTPGPFDGKGLEGRGEGGAAGGAGEEEGDRNAEDAIASAGADVAPLPPRFA